MDINWNKKYLWIKVFADEAVIEYEGHVSHLQGASGSKGSVGRTVPGLDLISIFFKFSSLLNKAWRTTSLLAAIPHLGHFKAHVNVPNSVGSLHLRQQHSKNLLSSKCSLRLCVLCDWKDRVKYWFFWMFI